MGSVVKGIPLRLEEALRQTTASLVCVDAERLDELARSCRDLVREEPVHWERLQAAERELYLLKRILDETRANLAILERLYEMRLHERGVSQRAGQSLWLEEKRMSSSSKQVVGYGDN
jgi:hypothetical protein